MILNIVTRLATAKNFYIITWEWYHITHKIPIILYHHLWHNFNYLLNMIQHNNSNSIAHSSYCIFRKNCYTIWMNLHSQLNERCNQSKIIWKNHYFIRNISEPVLTLYRIKRNWHVFRIGLYLFIKMTFF